MDRRAQRQAFISHPAARKYAQHVNPRSSELLEILGYGRVFTCAYDVWVRDDQHNQYLDLLAGFVPPGWGGHNHPRLAACIRDLLTQEPVNLFTPAPRFMRGSRRGHLGCAALGEEVRDLALRERGDEQ